MNEAAREAETFKNMYQQISSISQIGREITSSLNLEEIVFTIYRNLNIIMDSPVLGLGLYDEEKKEINYRFFIEAGEWLTPFKISVESEDSFGAWAINNRQEIVINDVGKEYSRYITKVTSTGEPDDDRLNSLIYIPLILGNKVIGILSMQSYAKNAFDDYRVEVFKTLASYITIAVENAKLYEEVKVLATKDPLTGLLNRSHFNSLAEREFKKYKRYGKEFSVVMFDLDHFKRVNDCYGHDGGDIVLKEISIFLSNEIRCTDLFCRYGGEEFLILLPHTNLSQAMILTKRLQEGLENLQIEILEGEYCSITASFGISCIKQQDEGLRELIKRADNALYESKKRGRNRISQSI